MALIREAVEDCAPPGRPMATSNSSPIYTTLTDVTINDLGRLCRDRWVDHNKGRR
jgi:hypothetical protein